MMLLARLAVLLAALTTLYFNGSYAWHTADAAHGKAGFVAMALAIDLCKITFLGAAAWCWAKGFRLRALALLLLWPLAFSASTFMAYAAITTQKETAAATTDGKAGDRARLQDRYDRTRADLATAQASPTWRETASCTLPKTKSHRGYCTNVASLQKTLTTLSTQLGPSPTLSARIELDRLAAQTGLTVATLAFMAAFLPALLLELLASLGSYAVGAKGSAKASQTASEGVSEPRHSVLAPAPPNAPEAAARPSAGAPPQAPPIRLPKVPRAQPVT